MVEVGARRQMYLRLHKPVGGPLLWTPGMLAPCMLYTFGLNVLNLSSSVIRISGSLVKIAVCLRAPYLCAAAGLSPFAVLGDRCLPRAGSQ